MVQINLYDSLFMKFENFLTKTKDFLIKRIAELFALFVIFIGSVIFISLLSYSPQDPNFIIGGNGEIKNMLGLRGSIVSDFLFQSIGLISYLFSFTLMITGINIFRLKEFFLFIENIFFATIYSVLGSLFLAHFYFDAFDFSGQNTINISDGIFYRIPISSFN